MKKRITSIALIIALLATCFAGTYAYLTDKDEAVNVMTLGKVKIEQHEYERAKNTDGTFAVEDSSYVLKDYENDKYLYPAIIPTNGTWNGINWNWDTTKVKMAQVDSYGTAQVLNTPNAVDKFVTVENTGKTAAYVRTLIAFEMGDLTVEEFGKTISTVVRAADDDASTAPWKRVGLGAINVDGNNFYVFEYTYRGASDVERHLNGVLPAGDTTYPSLCQVYMHHDATNETCEKIDGNNNGTFDILVISQAVQAAGFENAKLALDTAFGTSVVNAAEWFGGMAIPVSSMQELKNNLAAGGKVTVEENIGSASDTLNVEAGTTAAIDLQDNTMQTKYIESAGTLTVENGEVKSGDASNYGFIGLAGSETTFNNVDITTDGGALGATAGSKVTFNSGSVAITATTTNPRYNIYAVDEGTTVTINGGTFSFTSPSLKRAYVFAGEGTTVTINGGTFGAASTRAGYTAGILGSGTVIIKGGTFGFNPSAWVAPGYVAVQNGSTWTVSAQ